MADSSLADRAYTINNSEIKSTLDELSLSIAKMSALAQVTLCNEFWSCEQKVQYNYLWVLSDLIDHAQQLCHQSESNLLIM